jgi:molybdopterin molybdotransferase
MLRFEEALTRILELASPPLPTVLAPLEESDNRILAEDLVSRVDLPGFDYSSMDGYAIRVSDIIGNKTPFRFSVKGESRTGMLPDVLTPKTAMRIFTGAPIPEGADAVVMQENVMRDGDDALVTVQVRPGQSIRRRGEDLQAGSIAMTKGTRLRPAHLSLAASLDRAQLPVTERPEVSFLATGDELRRPGTEKVPGTIPESNTVALRAMARRAGGRARALPYVRDERVATERAFASALEQSDVVVTIGGVSVGDHDLVRPALEAVGVKLDFWRVAMKPGKPLAVGQFPRAGRRDVIVLGLPGNPASAMVTFALFGVPLLRALQGDPRPVPAALKARAVRAYVHDPGRTEFVRGLLGRADDGTATITMLANQASGAVTTMAEADALAVIPAESTGIPAGGEIDVIPLLA